MVHRGIMKLKTHNNMLGIPQIEKDIYQKFSYKQFIFVFNTISGSIYMIWLICGANRNFHSFLEILSFSTDISPKFMKNSNRTTVPIYTDLKIPMPLSITIFTSKYGSQKPVA